jgi:hypothetical protein
VYQMNESRLSIYNAGTEGNPITVRGVMDGNQRPILEPAVGQEVDRGFFYMWDTDSHWVFENLEFRDLRGLNVLYSPNAGGMFILGDDVTVRNCTFHDCDQGISSASLAEGTLLENCEFYSNGSDLNLGYAHNMYMNDASLTVRGCYSHDAYGGMLFKIRSEHHVLEYCWLENDGSEQCIANAASGNANNALWRGNVFIKRTTPGGQRRMLSFDDGTGLIGTATLINNTIISATTSDIYLTSASSNACDLVLKNNLFAGPSDMLLDWNGGGVITGTNNCFRTAMSPDVPAGVVDSVFSDNPGLVDLAGRDLHLLSSSTCVGAGINNPTYLNELAQWVDGTPLYEPTTILAVDVRPSDAMLDIGAYEWDGVAVPSVEFDLVTSSGDESVTTVNLSVSLDQSSSQTVTVDFAVTGGTAVNPDDYTIAASPLTFAPGVMQQDVMITVVDDGLVEADETIEVTLSNPTNATLGVNTVHTYTILDNDVYPSVDFDLVSSSGDESVTPVNLSVSLSESSASTVYVDYAVTGGTATGGGVDYTLAAGTLTFAPYDVAETIDITIVDDGLVEADETIEVTLSNPVNATLGTNTVHTYTILDNDGVLPPGQASNPSPYNGVTGVSRNVDLSWTAGSGADSHDVYFGTNPNPGASEFQGNQTQTTFDPGYLGKNTWYYWRIDEVNAGGTTTGVVWSFRTGRY